MAEDRKKSKQGKSGNGPYGVIFCSWVAVELIVGMFELKSFQNVISFIQEADL